MQPETLNRSIQPTPTVHPRGFTPRPVQLSMAVDNHDAGVPETQKTANGGDSGWCGSLGRVAGGTTLGRCAEGLTAGSARVPSGETTTSKRLRSDERIRRGEKAFLRGLASRPGDARRPLENLG